MKFFKKTLLSASLLTLTLTGGLLTAQAENSTSALPAGENDTVVATVNGEKVMKSTLDGYLNLLKKSGKADTQAALDDLVATEIALQQARKTDILEREDIKKKISDYSRNLLLTTWTQEKVASFNITEDEFKAEYDERVANLASKEYNARHILLKTEDEANAVIKDIEGGADFAKTAKEKSTGPSASNGGSLGWFKAQTMVPAFADAVKTMEKGAVSKSPVKTQFGYHVIKLEDVRDAKLPTLDSIKPQLQRVISQKKMLAHMEELKKTADVQITLPEEPAAEAAKDETKEKAE